MKAPEGKSEPSSTAPAPFSRYRRPLIIAAVVVTLYGLLGFFGAPWLIERVATAAVSDNLGAELKLSNVAVNPFVLSLQIDGLELDESGGAPLVRIEQIFVNFQLSSLFRWAWTFDEFRLDKPEIDLSRDHDGKINVVRLLQNLPAAEQSAPAAEKSELPRLIIQRVVINDSAIQWDDAVPVEPVSTRLGPNDLEILGLNTLPQRSGTQTVVISTETGATLSWNGSLQLNPLNTEGTASVQGLQFDVLSEYLRHQTGFDIIRGDANVQFGYRVAGDADGTVRAAIDDLGIQLSDILVRTHPGATGQTDEGTDVLSLPRVAVAGGRLRWPAQEIGVESVTIGDAVVTLARDAEGELDVVKAMPRAASDATAASSPEPAGAPLGDWQISLGRLGIENLAATLADASVQPAAESGVERLNLEVKDISNQPGGAFPTRLSFDGKHGGTVTLDGKVTVLPEPVLDFDLEIAGLALAAAHSYLQPLADVSMDSGALNVQAKFTSDGADPLKLTGDLQIEKFLLTETDEGSRLGSWDLFAADNIDFSLAGNRAEISQVRFENLYADILITEQREVNIGRIGRTESPADAASNPPADGADVEDVESEPFALTIGRVAVVNASADFADQSLPLPFVVKIAELNGELSTIATNSSEPSEVSLEGKVDRFGSVRISGDITPLDPTRDTDIKAAFRNVEMPKFSAYSVPFAGRKIASGKLSLDLGYRLEEGTMVGDNQIVLTEFELGEKVPHPDALDLPLGLAVALLTDSSGKIDVDLPVSGDINDPEFKIGGVVAKALVNLVVKIATAPFALLGKLVGVEASELENIQFIAGRSSLTPPVQETAAKIAEALAQRPQLSLEIPGVYATVVDGQALRTARLDRLVAERLGISADDPGSAAVTNQQRRDALETLYAEQVSGSDPEAGLDALRRANTKAAEGADGQDAEPVFDETAYIAALRRELIALQPLADADLEALGAERAANLRAAVTAANSAVEGQVVLADTEQVAVDGDEVLMKIKLKSGRGG